MAILSQAPDVYSRIVDLTEYIDSTPSTWGFLPLICEKGEDNKLVRVSRSEFLKNYGEPNINYTNDAQFGLGPYVAESFLGESDTLFIIRTLPDDAKFAHLAINMYGMDETGSGFNNWLDSTGGVAGSEDTSNPFKVQVYAKNYTNLNTYARLQQATRNLDTDAWYDYDFENAEDDNNQIDGTSTDPTLVLFYGIGRGAYYNNFQIDINQHPDENKRSVGIYLVDIYKRQTRSIRFSGSGEYDDYELIEQYEVSFDPDGKDPSGTGQSIFIEDIINEFASDIRVITNRTLLSEIYRRQTMVQEESTGDKIIIDFSEAFKAASNNFNPYDMFDLSGNPTPEFQAYLEAQGLDSTSIGTTNYLTNLSTHGINLSGGTDGSLFKIKTLLNGNKVLSIDTSSATEILAKAYTGNLKNIWVPIDEDDDNDDPEGFINEVLDTENFPFDIIFDAGYPQSVKDSITILAGTRRDALAIVDNGDHKTAASALKTRNPAFANVNLVRNTSSFNSMYVALYEPFTKIYDVFTGKDIWMCPSYHVARIIGFSDKNNEIWYPLAGFQRAVINNIKGIRYNPSNSDRDQFTRQQLNPIARFSNGYALFGQRTTKRVPSATQDVNVVRLILYIERALKRYCRNYIFELNIPETWEAINTEVQGFLKDVQNRRGLMDFSVSVGATPYEIRMRKLRVDIMLKPTRAIEQIELTFFIAN